MATHSWGHMSPWEQTPPHPGPCLSHIFHISPGELGAKGRGFCLAPGSLPQSLVCLQPLGWCKAMAGCGGATRPCSQP